MNIEELLNSYPLCYNQQAERVSRPRAKPLPSGSFTMSEIEQMADDGMFQGWYPVKVTFNNHCFQKP